MGHAKAYKLQMEVRPEELNFKMNSFTTQWFDLDERYKNLFFTKV